MMESPPLNEGIFKFAIRKDLLDTGDLFLPKKSEPFATGYDVYFAPINRQSLIIKPGEYHKLPLGFRSFCPHNWYYELHPRSSTFIKKYLHSLIGIIDETWEGETCLAVHYLPPNDLKKTLEIKFAEHIGQIIPKQKENITFIDISNDNIDFLFRERNSIRGTGGFGSTKDLSMIIYKAINKINNKIYIGQTTRTLKERIRSYKYEAPDRPFVKALHKYGFENFEFEIIDKSNFINELNMLEEEWIERLNTTNKNVGYNLRLGGSNSKLSEETKIKIGNAVRGEKNGFYGRSHSDETKLKISESHKGEKSVWFGRHHSNETKRKISAAQKGKPKQAEKKFKLNNEQISEIIDLKSKGHSYASLAKRYEVSRNTILNAVKRFLKG